MEVICDTNIWYNIANGNINLNNFKDCIFIATYLSIDELTKSEKLLNNESIEIIKNTINEIIKNQNLIYEPPFFNLLCDLNYTKTEIDNPNLLRFINDLLCDKQLTFDDKLKLKSYFEDRKKSTKLGSDIFEDIISELRINNRQKRNINKVIERSFIKEIVKSVTKQDLPNNFDWNRIELFEKTINEYFYKLITSNMSIKKNDWYDLAFLLYVNPNQKYWTNDKRFKNLIKESGLSKYLFLQ